MQTRKTDPETSVFYFNELFDTFLLHCILSFVTFFNKIIFAVNHTNATGKFNCIFYLYLKITSERLKHNDFLSLVFITTATER